MPGPLEDDMELAAALGRCTGSWSSIEYLLTMYFATLTGLNWKMAAALFDFFKSTRTQIDVFRRIVKIAPVATPDVASRTNALMTKYQGLATRRNDLCHNPFGKSLKGDGELYLFLKTKGLPGPEGVPWRTRPVSQAEIDALTADIDAFRNDLSALFEELHTWSTRPS